MQLGALALIVAAGLVGPLLAGRHGLSPPVVVGELLAGLAIGRTGLGWVDPTDPFLTGLASVGFALLMFIVGTHLPIRDRRLRAALVPGAGVAVTVVLLGGAVSLVVTPHLGLDASVILVLLVTSSGAVALPVLQSAGGTDRPALTAIVWIALADVATVIALPVVLARGSVGRAVGGVVVVAALGLALYAVARLARGRPLVERWRRASRARGWALELRISLLALFTAAWVAERFGASILIAGFTVGAVVALLGEPRRVADQLIALGEGFAVPLFFVLLGAQLDIGALARSSSALALAATLGVVAVAIHLVAARLWRLPVSLGLLASGQLGVPAAVASIGLSTGQLTAAQGSAVVASALVTLGACAGGAAMLGHDEPLAGSSAPQVRPAP